jgi:hypothetical protein
MQAIRRISRVRLTAHARTLRAVPVLHRPPGRYLPAARHRILVYGERSFRQQPVPAARTRGPPTDVHRARAGASAAAGTSITRDPLLCVARTDADSSVTVACALRVCQQTKDLHVELVVVSSMVRATQTAIGALAHLIDADGQVRTGTAGRTQWPQRTLLH